MGENREAAEQGEQPVEECVLMRLLFVAGRGAAAFAMVVIAGMVLNAMMPGWTDREAWWPWGSWAFIILFALGKEIERFSRKANRVCQQCKKREADGWENTEYCRHCEIRMFNLVCGECEDRRPSVKSGEGLCVQCERYRDWPLGGWQASRVDERIWDELPDAEPADREAIAHAERPKAEAGQPEKGYY